VCSNNLDKFIILLSDIIIAQQSDTYFLGGEVMDNNDIKLIALLEAGIIAVLLIALAVTGSFNSRSNDTTFYDPLNSPNLMENEVHIVEKELFVKNVTGNETFVVDESWDAFCIYVEGITDSVVSYDLTISGNPEGTSTANRTINPSWMVDHERIDRSLTVGRGGSIDYQSKGNWTLSYDVEGGLVKFTIMKIKY